MSIQGNPLDVSIWDILPSLDNSISMASSRSENFLASNAPSTEYYLLLMRIVTSKTWTCGAMTQVSALVRETVVRPQASITSRAE